MKSRLQTINQPVHLWQSRSARHPLSTVSPGRSRGSSRFVLLNAEMPCHVSHSHLHFTARFTLQCRPLQVNCHASKHLCRHQAWLQLQRLRAIQITSNRSRRRKGVSAIPIVLLTGICYSLKALTAAAS